MVPVGLALVEGENLIEVTQMKRKSKIFDLISATERMYAISPHGLACQMRYHPPQLEVVFDLVAILKQGLVRIYNHSETTYVH